MEIDDDFPAAHSMDSTWWAVDRDGHVALFSTGEAGAAPNQFYGGQDIPYEDALLALPLTEARHDIVGHRAMFRTEHGELTYGGNFIVFVRSASDLVDVTPFRLNATVGVAGLFQRPSPLLADLHTRGACVTCGYTNSYQQWAEHGAYVYEHVTENWICGPYARMIVPARPAHIDQLPAPLADQASRFDGRFADKIELQPAEHWECWGHNGLWLGLDRRTIRPLSIDSDDWYARAEELRDRFPERDFVIVPEPPDP